MKPSSLFTALLLSVGYVSLAPAVPPTIKPLVTVADLDVEEEQTLTLSDESVAKVKVLGLQETLDPIRQAVREARVSLLVNGQPALRKADPGVHSSCCGPNTWNAQACSGTVIVNGKGAHRLGDATKHCGGVGQLVEGSGDVIVGG